MSVCVLIVMLKSVLNPEKKISGAFRECVCMFVRRFIQLMYVTKYLKNSR